MKEQPLELGMVEPICESSLGYTGTRPCLNQKRKMCLPNYNSGALDRAVSVSVGVLAHPFLSTSLVSLDSWSYVPHVQSQCLHTAAMPSLNKGWSPVAVLLGPETQLEYLQIIINRAPEAK